MEAYVIYCALLLLLYLIVRRHRIHREEEIYTEPIIQQRKVIAKPKQVRTKLPTTIQVENANNLTSDEIMLKQYPELRVYHNNGYRIVSVDPLVMELS